jgi:C-terminal processing protease CtpA/Prc
VTLGPVKVDDLVVGFGTQDKGAFSDPNYEGNIGSGLLKRFIVTFDYDHQIMYLKPRPLPVADTGTFDRAGFWINTSAKGFEIVDLSDGGAAQSAGLKKGDQITSVDGKPATKIAISDMRQQLRDRPAGTKITLGVETAGQPRSVVLTLKDQI